jgi:NADH dehydrogenase
MTSRLEQGSVVTVFGGSGFLGRHAVRALARDGWRVRAAVRRPDLAGHLQPMGAVGQIQPVQANLRYPDSVRRAVEGARAVVNLVGILAKTGAQTFDAVHLAGARTVASAARAAGAETMVHVSALGADRRAKSSYARTKAAGEAAVLQEVSGAVILRPSLVFGPEDELFNRFAAMAGYSPFLPLIGGGRTKLQPLYAGDVGAAIAAVCAGQGKPGTIYEWAGPRSSPSACCSTIPRSGPAASAATCASPSGRPSSARCSPCRCPTACDRSPSTRSACCRATTS